MLRSQLTPKSAGIELWGEKESLKSLYDLICKMIETGDCIGAAQEELLLPLAYDVRKAYEGKFLTLSSSSNPSQPPMFGVTLMWPSLLIQCMVMQHALSICNALDTENAVFHAFQKEVKTLINIAMPHLENEVMKFASEAALDLIPYTEESYGGRYLYFMKQTPNNRRNKLPELLKTFCAQYLTAPVGSYSEIRPYELKNEDSWPDFNW